jgi:hypothetical protein
MDMHFLYNGRLVVGTIHKTDLLVNDANPRDILGIPDQLLGINGAKMSITFIEQENDWKVSCRAVHGHSVEFCKEMGGGYSSKQIGAFETQNNPLITMEKLRPYVEEQLSNQAVAKEFNPFNEATEHRPHWEKKGLLRLPQLFQRGKDKFDIASNHDWYIDNI